MAANESIPRTPHRRTRCRPPRRGPPIKHTDRPWRSRAALPTAFRHGFTPSAFACSDVAIAQPWFMTRTAEVSHRIGWTRRLWVNNKINCASSSKLAFMGGFQRRGGKLGHRRHWGLRLAEAQVTGESASPRGPDRRIVVIIRVFSRDVGEARGPTEGAALYCPVGLPTRPKWFWMAWRGNCITARRSRESDSDDLDLAVSVAIPRRRWRQSSG